MRQFQQHGHAELGAPPDDGVFAAVAINTEATLDAIKLAYEKFGYVLDPHSAVGYAACLHRPKGAQAISVMATAHPAKFPEAVSQVIDVTPRHATLEGLAVLPQRKSLIPATEAAV